MGRTHWLALGPLGTLHLRVSQTYSLLGLLVSWCCNTARPRQSCRERSERRKLQRAIRQEERGAARELRRDAGARRGADVDGALLINLEASLEACLLCTFWAPKTNQLLNHPLCFFLCVPLAAFMAEARDREKAAKQAELFASGAWRSCMPEGRSA